MVYMLTLNLIFRVYVILNEVKDLKNTRRIELLRYARHDCPRRFCFLDSLHRIDRMHCYFLSHLSSHAKNVRCHRIPFCGFSTQWFSSGNSNSWAGTPRRRAALNAAIDCDERMR